ncbi:MAG: VIT domain-containing protein [Planctomycetota bacterium]
MPVFRPLHLYAGLIAVIAAFQLRAFEQSAQFAANVIVPQSRSFIIHPKTTIMPPPDIRPIRPPHPVPAKIQITGVDVNVSINGQTSTTTLVVNIFNPTPRRQEAEMLVPVPDKAVIKSFSYGSGAGGEPTAQLLPREEARRIYNQIVSQMRDPAIVEFAGLNLIRTCVFPVEPNGTQKVQVIWEQFLAADGTRVDYVLPRTEAVDYNIPWTFRADIKAGDPISTVFSTTRRPPGPLRKENGLY